MTGWMVDQNDPACADIVALAGEYKIPGDPDKAAHYLGEVTLKGGKKVVRAHMVHAIDACIVNDDNVGAAAMDPSLIVMITRLHDPGMGKKAFPGGLLDPVEGGVETGVQASIRESLEEAGIHLSRETAVLIGKRDLDRPFDIRVAHGNGLEKKYGVKDGDVFMVTTQLVLFKVKGLSKVELKAGDDATQADIMKIDDLTRGMMGVADHYDMLQEALQSKGQPAGKRPKARQSKSPRPRR